MGYFVNDKWFDSLCFITQACIKQSELNYNHGKILYSLVSKYINNKKINNQCFTFIETGTARGFSSICISKALIDSEKNGKIKLHLFCKNCLLC